MVNDTTSIINSGLLDYVKTGDHIKALKAISSQTRHVHKGEVIFGAGDVIDRVCIVMRGSVRAEKTYTDGNVHIISVFDQGSMFAVEVAMSRTMRSPVHYIANENGRMLFIPITNLEENPYWECIRQRLIEDLADEVIRKTNKIEMLAERSTRNRVLVYLHTLAQKQGSNEVSISMNREQLAQFLCVNRTSLSNELSLMRQEKIIDFRKNKFRLLDGAGQEKKA